MLLEQCWIAQMLLSAIALDKIVQWTKLSWWVQCESVLAGEEAVITGHAVPAPFILNTQSSSSSSNDHRHHRITVTTNVLMTKWYSI